MKVSLIQLMMGVMAYAACVLGGFTNEEMLAKVKKLGGKKVFQLKENNYEEFLNGPRDYHLMLVLSSTSSQFNCPLCVEIKPDYELVANSWFQDHPNGVGASSEGKDVYFLYAEFLNAKSLFQKLQLNNIPKAYYVAPSAASAPDAWTDELEEYQFFQGVHTELISIFLGDKTGHKFNVYVPVSYSKLGWTVFIVAVVVLWLKVFFKQFKVLLSSKLLWTVLSIITILLFTSGYMFNQIRHTPYFKQNPEGAVEYFAGGQQTQYAIETQIVSFIYGILSLLFVTLVKKVPTIEHPKVKLLATGLVTISIYAIFSVLLAIFGIKSPGFPFKFFKIFG
ncbi:oligosaccharyl transferase subunit ost3/OST6 [Yamadazyma tenuis]|uniref:Gamma subunit of Oligosaccharyltransferase n=1 Tax=Candida tenuis (strain ATCC 10573 / BCRC 21748 / CBS 615 / JCM 9827 / NBRC 10315 / NRRL Y-1498 / VKM Y-70) TaxID=590646 RepID=G3B032_CANTC|nr:gamma subunit of Oligosaccharyltransferase [Yamadazyma tenuis ATCC 10573]EGV65303.1 gamma subunit of Oligosaccharyltransferase [Yamadazyma tenuis ATCC 10573]WEJ95039.1 oligosaccharyl transferase subunit ost3/OST6 [Yamadazyma tenuis]